MKTNRVVESLVVCWIAVAALSPLRAETKGTFDGDINAAAEAIEAAFTELEIAKVDGAITFVFATFVGKAETGSRILVSVNRGTDGVAGLRITSDGPEDLTLEKKLLEAIRAHEPGEESSVISRRPKFEI